MSRYRSSGSLSALPIDYIKNGVYQSTLTTGNPGVGGIKTMTDEVIERYKELSAKGFVFFNPMQSQNYVASLQTDSSAQFTNLNPAGPYYNQAHVWSRSMVDRQFALLENPPPATGGYIASAFPITSEEQLSMMTEASTAARANRGMPQGNNLWESLAEVDKSMKMFPDAIDSVRSLVEKTAREQWKKRNKSLYVQTVKYLNPKRVIGTGGILGRKVNVAANLYLMYRYGIKPLLNDAVGIVEGAMKEFGKIRITARGRVYQNFSSSEQKIRDISIGGSPAFRYVLSIHRMKFAEARAMMLDETWVDAFYNIGFSTKGFLGIPWELTPYSFVLDWLANLGDNLYAAMPTPELHALGSSLTWSTNEVTTVKCDTIALAQYRMDTPDVGAFESTNIIKSRDPGVLPAKLQFRNNFKFRNLIRSADAISLLLQRMKHPYR